MIESIRRSALFQSMPEWLRALLRTGYRGIFKVQSDSGVPQVTPLTSDSPAPAGTAQHAVLITQLYRAILERPPGVSEVQAWSNEIQARRISLPGLVEAIVNSSEADQVRERAKLLPDVSNGRFVQYVYEVLLERSPMAAEVAQWDYWLKRRDTNRNQMVLQMFANQAAKTLVPDANTAVHDPNRSPCMGTDRFISITEWQEDARQLGPEYPPINPRRYGSLKAAGEPEILVSAIASLFRGGDYIEQFLENITSQTIFATHCELIIIDANSPENEHEVIARYMERFPNIVYHRAPTRIGIYEAWNLGVTMARGQYLTNTNLDDLRRIDSFERQLEILQTLPFVDMVYQDFYYSFDGKASFDETAAVGCKSEVPVVTPYNLMMFNSPHNAPMWRRALHDDVGMFDASFRSAGDYEFWLRCTAASKTFYKINDPHVVYFVNPEGLSTRPDTRGIDEANRITKCYGRDLLSPRLLSSDDEFVEELSREAGCPLDLAALDRSAKDWRYTAVQRALRLHSIASRSRLPH